MINLELPELPYSKDALAPYMSAETLELHHDKHHMAYVTNGNKFIKENNLNEESIEEVVKKIPTAVVSRTSWDGGVHAPLSLKPSRTTVST